MQRQPNAVLVIVRVIFDLILGGLGGVFILSIWPVITRFARVGGLSGVYKSSDFLTAVITAGIIIVIMNIYSLGYGAMRICRSKGNDQFIDAFFILIGVVNLVVYNYLTNAAIMKTLWSWLVW